ncbi:MAG: RyR domain-containing protein [Sandaracinobacter sp.]
MGRIFRITVVLPLVIVAIFALGVSAWGGAQPAGLLAFGATYDFASAIGLFDARMDWLPRHVHEAYHKAAPDHAVANLPWDQPMIYLPAKLAGAGVDLSPWLGAGLPADGIHVPDLRSDPARLEKLAERHLSGWQHGPRRDNLRRRHPDLVPYAELSEASKRFDREIALATLEAVVRVHDAQHHDQGRAAR